MNKLTFLTSVKQKCIFLFSCTVFSLSLFAQLPSGFIDAKVQGGYVSPMGVIFSKNGQKMFVWEKSGKLWCSTWNGTTYIKQSTPSLDISAEVGDWRDFGFQSVALDPNFDTNGLIYLFYQVDRHHLLNFGTPQYSATTNDYFKPSISRVSRYKLVNNGTTSVADVASRKVLLGETKSTGVPLVHESHAGGQIVFGADGTLLVTTGDNASYASTDVGNASETYWQQAITDGIMRSTENVGAFRSQMINSFCGKLLRLDPNTGDGLASNPYYDAANPRSAKSRVWALGLRNPYRMSFKTGTGSTNPADGNPGTLLVADVQWNTFEDMHMVEKGGVNCGWPLYEGILSLSSYYNSGTRNQEETGSPTFQSLCVQATSATINPTPSQRRYTHAPPVLDWQHGQNVARYPEYSTGTLVAKAIGSAGAAVTGTQFGGNCATSGTYYTGTAFPANYRNVYFFADYGANWIKAVALHDNDTHQAHAVLDFAPAGYCKGVVDVEYCPRDESIFYVNINSGDIQKVSFGTGNRPPVAAISADKVSGTSPLTVNLSSNGSTDPDGNPITYNWNFGDGTANSTAANPTHTFSATGSRGFTVTLTVTDNGGLTDTKTLVISVNNTAPSVRITNPLNDSKYTLTGATQAVLQSTVTDNDAASMQYAWQVTLRHNNHEHREPIINQQSPTVQISPIGCDGETYYYLIELQVTDNGGLTARDSVKIYPDCTTQSLAVTNLTATAQNNAVAVNWTNPPIAFDEVMVVAKANSGFLTNPSGTTYTANASFTGAGTAFEGGKVVYRGTGTGMTVTSLTANTRYYFRVFTRKGTTWTGGVETSAVPTGTAVQLGCLKGSYFNNIGLTGTAAVVRAESSINYDWTTGSPVAGINADNFSARWEGTVIPPTTGTYTFTVTGDDGVRLWVNNVQIINKWVDQSPTTYTATVALTQGQNVPIKLEYYERGGGAVAKLLWTIPGQTSKVVAFSACPITTTAAFDATKCYRLTARVSNKAVEVPGSSTTNGTQLQQRTYLAGAKNQLWRIKDLGDGSYRLVNTNSGKSADVSGAGTANSAAIIQWDWHGGNNQRWIFTKNTEGYYQIKAKHSSKVFDVKSSGTTDGTLIQQYTANATTAQQFKIDEIGCPVGAVASESANILMASAHREGKKAVITWVSNANDNTDYFMVQKLNARELVFEKMDIINVQQGSADSKNVYSVVDEEPTDDENIYRVVLFRDGAVLPQYSEILKVDFTQLSDFMLFPNPSNDYVDIDLESVRYRSVDISVLDAAGKIVRQQKIVSAPVAPLRMNLTDLEIGQYFIRIEAEGKREVVKKLMIVR